MIQMFDFILTCIEAFFGLWELKVLGIPIYIFVVSGAMMMLVAAFIKGRRE